MIFLLLTVLFLIGISGVTAANGTDMTNNLDTIKSIDNINQEKIDINTSLNDDVTKNTNDNIQKSNKINQTTEKLNDKSIKKSAITSNNQQLKKAIKPTDNVIYISPDGTNESEGTKDDPTTIHAAIDYTNQNSKNNWIIKANNGIYILNQKETINSNLTIQGSLDGSTVFSGNHSHGILYLNNYKLSLTVNNINFINVKSDKDAGKDSAIFVDNGTLTVTDCNFTNNFVSNAGAAIAYYVSDDILTENNYLNITGCNFIKNTAGYYGGALRLNSLNGLALPKVYITRSNFINNTADSSVSNNTERKFRGGAINFHNIEGFITDCTFINNTAGESGGAIRTDYKLTINNTIFDSNNILNKNSETSGTAIFNNNGMVGASTYSAILNLINCTFINHKSLQNGTIFVYGDCDIKISNCAFINNTASNGSAIYNAGGNILIENNTIFRNNSAIVNGGSIYNVGGTVIISNSSFEENNALNAGVIYNSNNSTYEFIIKHSNFINNRADNGGVIFSEHTSGAELSVLSIDTSLFKYNSANYGGVIYTKDSIISITKSNFTYNDATLNGGVLFNNDTSLEYYKQVSSLENIQDSLEIDIQDSNFTYNNAIEGNGGAIYNEGEFKLNNSNLEHNYARINGGAIYTRNPEQGSDYINNSYLNDNVASNNGGAIYNLYGTFSIYNSRISNSKAVNGSVIYNEGDLTSENNIYEYNHANFGAIYNTGTSIYSVLFNNDTFNQNYASNVGGAIYTISKLDITNTTFNNNEANLSAGTILNMGSLTVYNATFYNNTARHMGAILNIGDALINKSTFINNTATGKPENPELGFGIGAGAIYNEGSIKIDDCSFYNNTALQLDGGTIYTKGDSTTKAVIIHSNFYNSVGNRGGIIYNNGSALEIDIVYITQGQSTKDGGFLYNNQGYITIIGSYILNNIAESNGGAIYTNLGNLTITNCTIKNNTAHDNGGAIYITENGNNTISLNSIFNNNASLGKDITLNNSIINTNNIINDNWWGLNEPTTNPIDPISKIQLYWTTWNNRVYNTNNIECIPDSWLNINMDIALSEWTNVRNDIIFANIQLVSSKDNITRLDFTRETDGNVTLFTSDKNLITTNSSKYINNVTYQLASCNAGKVNLTVVGYTDYQPIIKEIYNSKITSENIVTTHNQVFSIKGNLTYKNPATPLLNTNITIIISQNDKELYNTTVTTDEQGNFNKQIDKTTLKPGMYNINLIYKGNTSNDSIWDYQQGNTLTILPLLIINKTTITEAYLGDTINFTITIKNYDTDYILNDIIINDKLDINNFEFITCSDPLNYNVKTGEWKVTTLSPDETETLNLTVKTKINGILTNTIKTTILNTEISNTTTIIVYKPEVILNEIVNSDTTYLGNNVTFTITIRNLGKLTLENINVIDILNTTAFKFINTNDTNFNYITGIWNVGNLAQYESKSLNITVKTLTTGLLENNINTTLTENNIISSKASVNSITPDVILNKTVNKNNLNIGDIITFTISIKNNLEYKLNNVIVNDMLTNTAFEYLKSNATVGNYDNNTGKWIIDTLTKYNTEKLDITVKVISKGTLTNTVTSSLHGINIMNNTIIYVNNNIINTVTRLEINPKTTNINNTSTIKASVTDVDGNIIKKGSVTFTINDTIINTVTLDSEGKAIIQISKELPNNYTIKAIYNGISNLYNTSNDISNLEIIPINTTIKITTNITTNHNIILQGNVTTNFGNYITDGNIIIYLNGTIIANNYINNSMFNIETNITNSGKYNFLVVYTGTNIYHSSNTTCLVTLENLNTTIIVDPVIGIVEDNITLHATITNQYGIPVESGKIVFKINDETLKDINGQPLYVYVYNGSANLNIKIPYSWAKIGNKINAVYSGTSTKYNSARSQYDNINCTLRNINIQIITNNQNIKAQETTTYIAVISDKITNELINGQVVFKFQGHTIKDNEGNPIIVNVTNGIGKLNYTILNGISAHDYNITVVFKNNSYYRTENNTIQKVSKINTNIKFKTTIVSNNKIKIQGTIKDITGINTNGTNKIAIKINGKTLKDNKGNTKYYYIKNGNINLTILTNTTLKRINTIELVTGERLGYHGTRTQNYIEYNKIKTKLEVES